MRSIESCCCAALSLPCILRIAAGVHLNISPPGATGALTKVVTPSSSSSLRERINFLGMGGKGRVLEVSSSTPLLPSRDSPKWRRDERDTSKVHRLRRRNCISPAPLSPASAVGRCTRSSRRCLPSYYYYVCTDGRKKRWMKKSGISAPCAFLPQRSQTDLTRLDAPHVLPDISCRYYRGNKRGKRWTKPFSFTTYYYYYTWTGNESARWLCVHLALWKLRGW